MSMNVISVARGAVAHASSAHPLRRAALQGLCCLLLAMGVVHQAAAQQVSTPAVGTPDRRGILDALRVPVEQELGQAVRFRIDRLRVSGEWAFLVGTPESPQGNPVDYGKTDYAEAVQEGMFDDGISALLRKAGSAWTPVTYAIGSTDVPWVTWAEEHGAPAVLFESE